MKKEYIFQLIAVVIFYFDHIIYVEFEGIQIEDAPFEILVSWLVSCSMFLVVNYVLIPKLFHTKRYLLFFGSLIGLIVLYGVLEEGVVEKLISPNRRGVNDVTWQSIYWFFGEIIVPLLTFMTIKLVFDGFRQEQKLIQLEKDRLGNELKLLKSQMQPHILFNSLNNLYHFACKKSDEVPDLILKLSNVLRYVLYETSDERVTLSKEITFIKDYVDLQKIQYSGRGNITLNLPDPKAAENLLIAPFLLIPFIENSFKHSFGTLTHEVKVDIQLTIKERGVHLLISNNFDQQYQNSTDSDLVKGGIGLENVKKRLELLYADNYTLRLEESMDTYRVNLNLELNP